MRKKPDKTTQDIWSLQLKLRSLERQLEEMRSGKAYERLEESRKKLIREYEAKVKALRKELDERDKEYSRQLNEWFKIFADAERGIRKECELEVRRAKREAKGQEDRALRAERRVDELLDRVRDMARQMRELVMEKLDLEAKLAKLVALISKDFTNSSIPSSQQGPGRKPVPNSREKTDREPGAQPGPMRFS